MLHLNDYSAILAASSDSDSWSNIGFVFLLSGFVFYGLMFLVYRNVDKRHRHESETATTKHNVQAVDERVQSLKGLEHSKMRGANNTQVRGATNSLFTGLGSAMDGISPIIGQIRRQVDDQRRD